MWTEAGGKYRIIKKNEEEFLVWQDVLKSLKK